MNYKMYEFFNYPNDINNITWNMSLQPHDPITRYIENDIKITKEAAKKMLNERYGNPYPYAFSNPTPKPKKVYYDEAAGVTVVLWTDNTKTIVRAAEGDKHDAYLGYCTALAKKIHGTNSALKRDLEKVLVRVEKKEKGNKNEKG